MDNKTENQFDAKVVAHVINEKDVGKPEYAGLTVGTPIMVIFTKKDDEIRAARIDKFDLHIVQAGENIKNQQPGSVVAVLENSEYATVDEINIGLNETLKSDFLTSDKVMKLDDESLDSIVGGKITNSWSWGHLFRFAATIATSIVGGGIPALVSVGVAAATSAAEGFSGLAKNDTSDARVSKTLQPYANLLPWEMKV